MSPDAIINIREISPSETPMELVYEADESEQSVSDYIGRGKIYAAYSGEDIAGICVLLHTRPFTAEIVNIAVEESYRGRGIGKQLVAHAVRQAREQGYKVLDVRTANAGISQIAFYQKCGFNISHIDHDYITRLYPGTITENGIECRHMVCLNMYL